MYRLSVPNSCAVFVLLRALYVPSMATSTPSPPLFRVSSCSFPLLSLLFLFLPLSSGRLSYARVSFPTLSRSATAATLVRAHSRCSSDISFPFTLTISFSRHSHCFPLLCCISLSLYVRMRVVHQRSSISKISTRSNIAPASGSARYTLRGRATKGGRWSGAYSLNAHLF